MVIGAQVSLGLLQDAVIFLADTLGQCLDVYLYVTVYDWVPIFGDENNMHLNQGNGMRETSKLGHCACHHEVNYSHDNEKADQNHSHRQMDA